MKKAMKATGDFIRARGGSIAPAALTNAPSRASPSAPGLDDIALPNINPFFVDSSRAQQPLPLPGTATTTSTTASTSVPAVAALSMIQVEGQPASASNGINGHVSVKTAAPSAEPPTTSAAVDVDRDPAATTVTYSPRPASAGPGETVVSDMGEMSEA